MNGEDLTLEKLRVSERLTSLEGQVITLIELKKVEHAYFKENAEKIQAILDKVIATVYGNGAVGLTTQIVQNTAAISWLVKMMWAVGFTIFGLGAKAVLEHVFYGMGG